MIRSGTFSLAAGLALAWSVCAEAPPGSAPDFREVYDLIHQHLTGITDEDLNRSAVQGLLSSLGPKVTLVGGTNQSAGAEAPLVSRSTLFDGSIAYVRVKRVEEGLAKSVRGEVDRMTGTNALKGLVLDLRFAAGDDYAASAATADLFLKKERPLLDWGQGVVQSKEKADAIDLPVAVLVNHETTGAAEALAAVLRQAGSGLVFGSNTAGLAMIAQDFPLNNGQKLRIASGPVHLGDGSELSNQGLKPDINVPVAPAAEQSYYADAYKEVLKTNASSGASLIVTNPAAITNRARRPRFNEAELVRERKLGVILDSDLDAGGGEPERPTVQDPVLARALDVLKGLSLVRQSHS